MKSLSEIAADIHDATGAEGRELATLAEAVREAVMGTVLLGDILNAARRGEMGSMENAVRYCDRIASAAGADWVAYAKAAEMLVQEAHTAGWEDGAQQ